MASLYPPYSIHIKILIYLKLYKWSALAQSTCIKYSDVRSSMVASQNWHLIHLSSTKTEHLSKKG